MAFKRWGCHFDGPWPNADILKRRKGIWVLWLKKGYQWDVIAVGESGNIRASFEKPGSQPPPPVEGGSIYYSATYTPGLSNTARRNLASRIRKVADHN